MKYLTVLACAALSLTLGFWAASATAADSLTADMFLVDGKGETLRIGTVVFTDTNSGLAIKTDLNGLPPGAHGFHIHEKGSCEPAEKDGKMTPAGAAGGHYDPQKTGKHLGPGGGGHAGDLPALIVAPDGTAKETMDIGGLTTTDIKGRAIMVHAGGDNYSDMPVELGGGGARLACGVIR
ncbi:superoxide dismutase, Cu, Zn [uncultured delta proteobacterium]|uniref:Superoxide dismutase [Cu-Zn] n=1 Tax=uncultured delta proteobacterium TaxID=34034 RepID=A0A212J0M1_9DELT|nr:superoxide dismutase, Cu, Zn [uncultured delta proteobacterium]